MCTILPDFAPSQVPLAGTLLLSPMSLAVIFRKSLPPLRNMSVGRHKNNFRLFRTTSRYINRTQVEGRETLLKTIVVNGRPNPFFTTKSSSKNSWQRNAPYSSSLVKHKPLLVATTCCCYLPRCTLLGCSQRGQCNGTSNGAGGG